MQLNVAAILPYWVYVIFAYCETVFRVVVFRFSVGHSEVLAQNEMGTNHAVKFRFLLLIRWPLAVGR